MPSSFKSNDVEMSEILKKIASGDDQLPDFQRGWVWDDNRIVALIASISNSYPVGAVMFLEYNSNSIRFKYRPFTAVKTSTAPDILVLDGQQRLTSIFCALYSRDPVPTKNEKNTSIQRYFYLDIKKCLDPTVDREDAILSIPIDKKLTSNFGRTVDLDISTRDKEFENHFFPLNLVYDLHACSVWRNDYQKYHNYTPAIMDMFTDFDTYVLSVIQRYKVPVITLEKSIEKEAVCKVFENVNTGGVSLTVFELMTAIYAVDGCELRKDWENRKKDFDVKSALSATDIKSAVLYGVEPTDFLAAVTLLSRYKNKQAVSCKRKDILQLTYAEYSN
jgi:hypothetical protein